MKLIHIAYLVIFAAAAGVQAVDAVSTRHHNLPKVKPVLTYATFDLPERDGDSPYRELLEILKVIVAEKINVYAKTGPGEECIQSDKVHLEVSPAPIQFWYESEDWEKILRYYEADEGCYDTTGVAYMIVITQWTWSSLAVVTVHQHISVPDPQIDKKASHAEI
ncbi:hypothetical protein EDB19DRAFT_2023776 [Suillus lakei]|nr:hypothetical protein EDB19DRAFT_2023776 [Suillus lakei]